MTLKPPIPGLRNVHYDARSAAKVQIIVQPGDTLAVSDDVAEQLAAASSQFKAPPDPPKGRPDTGGPTRKRTTKSKG